MNEISTKEKIFNYLISLLFALAVILIVLG